MTVSIKPTQNPEDLYLGRYKSIQVKADSAVTNGIRLHNFELILEGVQINLYDLLFNGKLILFELERIFPRGTIRFDELEGLVAQAMKNRGKAQLKGREDQLILEASYRLPRGNNVTGKAVVRVEFKPDQSIRLVLESLNLGPLSVPQAFYRRMSNIEVRLQPTLGWPLNTDIRSIRILPHHIEINQHES